MGLGGRKPLGIDQAAHEQGQDQGGGGRRHQGQAGDGDPAPIGPQEGQHGPSGARDRLLGRPAATRAVSLVKLVSPLAKTAASLTGSGCI